MLVLLAVVVLAHVLALQWLARQMDQAPLLRPMATPMFTRLLQPSAVVVAPATFRKDAPRAKPRARRVAVAMQEPAAVPAAPAASQPAPMPAPAVEPAPPAPLPETAVAAAPPEPAASAASAPVPASSAPVTSTATAANSVDSWPADTRLNYRLGGQFRSGELYGSARVQWQRQGERYQSRVEIDVTLLASLVLTSQGEVTPQGLFPRAYEELRRSGPRGAKMGDDSIVLNDGRSVPRPQGVQDAASQFVELSHRFSTGQNALEVGRSVSFWLARPGGVDLWTYDIVGREMLQTGELGLVEAFHLKPRPIVNPRGNVTAEMWFAPTLQYLPVRIRVSMGEGFVDLTVDRIEQR
jgi:hypothetical protein